MQQIAGAQAQLGSASAEFPTPRYLDTAGAAKRMACKARLLESLRSVGGGPRWVRIGRQVRYRTDWLDTWAEQNSVTSTSEEAARRDATGDGGHSSRLHEAADLEVDQP